MEPYYLQPKHGYVLIKKSHNPECTDLYISGGEMIFGNNVDEFKEIPMSELFELIAIRDKHLR